MNTAWIYAGYAISCFIVRNSACPLTHSTEMSSTERNAMLRPQEMSSKTSLLSATSPRSWRGVISTHTKPMKLQEKQCRLDMCRSCARCLPSRLIRKSRDVARQTELRPCASTLDSDNSWYCTGVFVACVLLCRIQNSIASRTFQCTRFSVQFFP